MTLRCNKKIESYETILSIACVDPIVLLRHSDVTKCEKQESQCSETFSVIITSRVISILVSHVQPYILYLMILEQLGFYERCGWADKCLTSIFESIRPKGLNLICSSSHVAVTFLVPGSSIHSCAIVFNILYSNNQGPNAVQCEFFLAQLTEGHVVGLPGILVCEFDAEVTTLEFSPRINNSRYLVIVDKDGCCCEWKFSYNTTRGIILHVSPPPLPHHMSGGSTDRSSSLLHCRMAPL